VQAGGTPVNELKASSGGRALSFCDTVKPPLSMVIRMIQSFGNEEMNRSRNKRTLDQVVRGAAGLHSRYLICTLRTSVYQLQFVCSDSYTGASESLQYSSRVICHSLIRFKVETHARK
jgi:hypothetical protein